MVTIPSKKDLELQRLAEVVPDKLANSIITTEIAVTTHWSHVTFVHLIGELYHLIYCTLAHNHHHTLRTVCP